MLEGGGSMTGHRWVSGWPLLNVQRIRTRSCLPALFQPSKKSLITYNYDSNLEDRGVT